MTLLYYKCTKLKFIYRIKLAMSENFVLGGCSICISRAMADFFCENSPIFVTMATMTGQGNFIGTSKSAITKNPLFGAHSAALAFVQDELGTIWVENGRIFVTMATRVDPMKI